MLIFVKVTNSALTRDVSKIKKAPSKPVLTLLFIGLQAFFAELENFQF